MPYPDSTYERSWKARNAGVALRTDTPGTHTPAPWTLGPCDWMISQSHGVGYRNFPVRAPDGFDVCLVYSDEDDAEQAANVRLILSAPELLAACRAMAEHLDEFVAGSAAPYLAVIAKAEGRG